MVLTKIKELMTKKGLTPETLAAKSNKAFSNMTVRRAIAGRGIDRLKAVAIARAVGAKLEDLI